MSTDRTDTSDVIRFASDGGLRYLVVLGGALAVIGAFLPWLTSEVQGSTITVTGVATDGFFTFIGATVVILIALFRWNKRTMSATLLIGLVITIIGSVYVFEPTFRVVGEGEIIETVRPAFGVYLTLIGGILIVVHSATARILPSSNGGRDYE